MINIQYKLISSQVITPFFSNLNLKEDKVLVRPEWLSICKADMRYYLGTRDMKTLQERLPLVLIHEAVGKVLLDNSGEFQKGEQVVLLPNIPGTDEKYDENYRMDSLFSSSKTDGFMQESVLLSRNQLVKYNAIPAQIASFTEFISVGIHAVCTYLKKKKPYAKKVAVWGDGVLGYILCLILKYYCSDLHVSIIGVNRRKLELFKFVDEIYTAESIPDDPAFFDDAFECVGGEGTGIAINQMIDVIRPEGILTLMGVNEHLTPINTRMVLEKGITMIGRSRSTREDFIETIKFLTNNERIINKLKKMISEEIVINGIDDMHRAFECAKAADYKVIMKWKI